MAEERGGTTDGTEDERIPWMLQQHAGTETIAGPSTEEVCRRELDNYLEYVWRPVSHQRRVSAEERWCKREYLWPRIATITRRRIATQASSACSERSFSKASLICAGKRMMRKPEHVDVLSLLGWDAIHEKGLLKQSRIGWWATREKMRGIGRHGLNNLVGSICQSNELFCSKC